MYPSRSELMTRIDACRLADRPALRRLAEKMWSRQSRQQPVDTIWSQLSARLERSQLCCEQLAANRPVVEYPEQLPIADQREKIAALINEHQVVIVAGETGSGKTTQLPKICLELGRGISGMIGHTQPRRLAARSVANRIAEELKTPLGEGVGYQVRFTDQVSERSYIKLMTDGILLAEIQRDRDLLGYDTLIIDEAHERSLNIDFLLGYLKQLLPRRPDLKLIITSATIDLERFSKHFDDAPIIEIGGRTYPVEVRYRPMDELSDDGELAPAIERVIDELIASETTRRGDMLIFLSGEADIRQVALHLRRAQLPHCEILPLYARLSNSEQNKIFSPQRGAGRRIILATNVAETSLTVPGIRYVIDPGFARISRYSFHSKIQRLPIEPISQASANQRKGRCGRVAEGICVRLYSEEDFNNRPEFTDPEIRRTNLASVILQMLTLRIGEIDKFPFVDPPDRRMINDGFKLLQELGAVDRQRQLTDIGRALARFPVDPRWARMLIAAAKGQCLHELMIIVSGLTIQDPRERPADKRQAADEKHRRFQHDESDFLAYLQLWDYFEQQRQELSQNQLRKLCQREFLAYLRMREWREIHHQLRLVCRELKLKENTEPADFQSVHRALIAGLMSHAAMLDEDRQYLGARNRKLRIFPGSGLFKKSPKWIISAEIAETSQVFARCCASIDSEWLIGINDALLKQHYSEPHWSKRSGRVMAYEKLTLYGLVVRDRKKVHYGPIDPLESHRILLRSGLVEERLQTRGKFMSHNHALIEEVHDIEAKARRRDVMVDDEQIYRFYAERVPADIVTAASFEHWRKQAEKDQPELLYLCRALLMRHGAEQITGQQFPDFIRCGDIQFALAYRFEPSHVDDGVTATLPIGLLNRVPQFRFEWLVPGLLRDKCIALVKTLPKQLRKQLVPIPDTVDALLPQLTAADQSLLEALAQGLKKSTRVDLKLDDWQPDQLDDFYRMNFHIVDADGQLLGRGRNLAELLARFKGQVTESVQQQVPDRLSRSDLTAWEFGELPKQHQLQQAGVTITTYPALVDRGNSVAIELMDYREEADQISERGLARLLMLQMPQQIKMLRKDLLTGNQLNLQLASIDQQRSQWLEDLLFVSVKKVFIEGRPLPRNAQQFQQLLVDHKADLVPVACELAELLMTIAADYSAVRKVLSKARQLTWIFAVNDIQQQLSMLFAPGFIADTPRQWLAQYPRYLKAVAQRIDKLAGHLARDKQLMQGLSALVEPLLSVWHGSVDAERHCPPLLEFRWMLEEYRVSLFAQSLGTLKPVSEKRLRDLWQQLKPMLANYST